MNLEISPLYIHKSIPRYIIAILFDDENSRNHSIKKFLQFFLKKDKDLQRNYGEES